MQKLIEELAGIDVQNRISEVSRELKLASNPRVINALVKELKILRSLDKDGKSPLDAYTQTTVPVIPAMYRSPAELSNGTIRLPDINLLLRDIGIANGVLSESKKVGLPQEEIENIRHKLYKSVEQMSGFDAPTENRKVVHNAFTTLAGKGTPKSGFFQRNVIRKRQDLTGRSTLTPDPTINIDEVKLPKKIGYKVYEPWVKKELFSMGYDKDQVDKLIKDDDKEAFIALKNVSKDRPVLFNRAPSIRNTSVNAMFPIFTDGMDIGVPNLLAGLNPSCDFDGDTASIHVPVTDKGKEDSYKLLPSRNLVWEPTGELLTGPNHAAATGIYLLSQSKEGIDIINNVLPGEYRVRGEINKSDLFKILKNIDKDPKYEASKIMEKLRAMGDDYIFRSGHSIGISDIKPYKAIRKRVLDQIKAETMDVEDKDQLREIYDRYGNIIINDLKKTYKEFPTSTGNMLLAKARGNPTQFRDVVATPLASRINPINTPIEHGYSEGLDPWEYWSAAFGARKAIISKSQETAMPGALAGELLTTTNHLVIGDIVNDNTNVIWLSIDKASDILDRYIGSDVYANGNVVIKKGELVTPDILRIAGKNKLTKLPVYTVMGSSGIDGALPAMGYGNNRKNQLLEIGDNVGVISSHAIVDPLFTGSLKSFHTGGSASDTESGYPRIKQLLEMHKKLPKQAILSKEEGSVTNIVKDDLNGHNVYIGNSKYYVQPENKVMVNVGDTVTPGDPLSNGPIQPEEIAKYKGLDVAQEYLVEELQKNVPNAKRRSLEVVVEGITRYGKILSSGGTDMLPGDVFLISKIKHENAQVETPAEYEVLFKGVNQLPQMTDGWISQLAFRHLKRLMQRNIGEGAEEAIHSYSPVIAIVKGQGFGTGDKGKY